MLVRVVAALMFLLWASPALADGLGDRRIDEVVDYPLSTGTGANCDSTPTISVYEGNEATPSIRSAVNMTQRTAAGRYYYRETLSAANGYEVGKTYHVYYACTLSGSLKEPVDVFEVVPTPSTLVATDNIGINWADVSNPTSNLVLSGTTIGTLTTYTGNTPQTGDVYALANGASGFAGIYALIDTEIGSIKTKTDFLPSATAGAAGGVFIAGANAPTTVDGQSLVHVATVTPDTGNTNTITIPITASVPDLTASGQFEGMWLECGTSPRKQIAATANGTPDTISVQAGAPFATAPNSGTCTIWRDG